MNKLKWYYNRLKIMGAREIFFFRIPQFIQLNVLGHLQAIKELKLISVSEHTEMPNYTLSTLKRLFGLYPFQENYSFFNTRVNVLKITDWRKDYLNEITSPLVYYNKIDRQDFSQIGDVKFVAEISRLHFMPFLAFKYVESEKVDYSNRIEEILETWNAQNPYLKSIHWTSGIEVAIRSVNLIYTHHILKSFNCLSSKADMEIRKQITYSYQFLKNHLSLYSSANNHLMAELMGLNVISSYFNVSKKQADSWRAMFYDQILKQVNEDGVHMELCTRYHSEVLDQIIIGLHFLKAKETIHPKEITSRLEKMFHFVQHVSYCGVNTIFGDNDEGFVLNPYFSKNETLYESQIKTSNFLHQTQYKSNGETDFRNYLIFGEVFNTPKIDNLPETTFFENSGYCFMYDHENDIKLSFDVGKIGDDISAAHGHSDMFHFNLQQGIEQILVDPGTYQYHKKESLWRNYFRGVTAHNTISINKQNHADANNRMSWINRPDKPKTKFILKEDEIICESEHLAFKKDKTIHKRTIKLFKKFKKITIIDRLVSETSFSTKANFYLHFHPNHQLSKNNNTINVTSANNKELKLENSLFNLANIVEGNADIPFGWYSNSYNFKQKSKSLVLNLEVQKQLILETNITYE